MRRHELWRLNYRSHRDLDHLSAEELSERFHDCINNVRTRTDGGKIGLLAPEEPLSHAWLTLTTEIMEECKLRGYPYPGPISLVRHRASLDHALDPIPDMGRAFAQAQVDAQKTLLKFGEPKWLKRSFETGCFRIASASYYDAAEHNHARRDTELTRHFRLNPRHPAYADATEKSSSGWSTVAANSDYLLFCLATKYSGRLFGDFAASACLVIHNPPLFTSRVAAALQEKLPRWRIQAGLINYYDPVRTDPRGVAVPWFKSFKHAYQHEMRLVCLPPYREPRLDPVEIEIGSLEDCAVYVDHETYSPPAVPRDPADDPLRVFRKLSTCHPHDPFAPRCSQDPRHPAQQIRKGSGGLVLRDAVHGRQGHLASAEISGA